MKFSPSVSDINSLRENWTKFVLNDVKGEFVGPVSMVNNGYLHALNASFDGLFLREQGVPSLLQASRSMNFGTIQPCVRMEDKLSLRSSLLHLGLFEIYGYSILGFDSLSPAGMAEETIADFCKYYIDYLGCDMRTLRVYYFAGATLREATNGKADSDEYIPPDDFSVSIWKSYGLVDSQLIPDTTQETFLLHTGNPTREHHSGYRNDIFMVSEKEAFEIATLNFISHHTIVKNDRIVGITKLPFYLRELALGQERCLAAIAGINNLYELPHVHPLVTFIESSGQSLAKAMVIVDMLRILHYTIADGWVIAKLSGKRHKVHRHDINSALRIVANYREAVSSSSFEQALAINADLQPWYPTLKQSIPTVLKEIEDFSSHM